MTACMRKPMLPASVPSIPEDTRIYTSIDLNMQTALQQSVDDNLKDYTDVGDDGIYEMQSSAVCIDNETGYVKAIVGGRSQQLSGYTLNRAYQSFRQPGSSIEAAHRVYTGAGAWLYAGFDRK